MTLSNLVYSTSSQEGLNVLSHAKSVVTFLKHEKGLIFSKVPS